MVDTSTVLAWCFPDESATAPAAAGGPAVSADAAPNLLIVEDTQPAVARVHNVVPIAREFGLPAHDAAYLELGGPERGVAGHLGSEVGKRRQGACGAYTGICSTISIP